MSLFKIIPTIFSGFGCVANSFCLTYFLLFERKGLTNKLFIFLSIWDFLNSAVVTVRVWLPLSTRVFMNPLYIWVLNNNHFLFILIAMTRMIKICAPFYRIEARKVWIAMLIDFLYNSSVAVTLNTKGEFVIRNIFNLDGWQLAKFIHDIFWCPVFVVTVMTPNIVSGIKLLRPGASKVAKSNVQAAKTVMIISTIFLLSNSLLYLTVARNIKYVIQKNLEPLIPGYNTLLGFFFFRLLMLLNAVCNPIVYFIRNKNFRSWALMIPRSIKNAVFSKVMTESTIQNETGNNEKSENKNTSYLGGKSNSAK